MAFTQDELQALNNIFDQKMAILQDELESSLNQRMQVLKREFQQHVKAIVQNLRPDLEAIEIQTEIACEDLTELINKVLMERLAALNVSLQSRMQEMERALTVRIRQWYDNAHYRQPFLLHKHSDSLTNMQDVFTNLEQLEHLIESMQVTMTTNSTLLANRLYHHQQLPLEQAHSSHQESNNFLHSFDKATTPISLPEDT